MFREISRGTDRDDESPGMTQSSREVGLTSDEGWLVGGKQTFKTPSSG